jgi:hypothetical protein
MELSEIEENYKRMSSGQLLKLAKEADTLRPEVIPLLKKELSRRGMKEEASEIDKIKEDQFDYKKLSLKEIQEVVSDRLQTGESLESIKVDLEDKGVDILDVFNVEGDKREAAFEIIASQKDGQLLNDKLKAEFDYGENEVQELKKEMKSRANIYVNLGIFVLVLSVGLLFVVYATNGRSRSSYALMAAGFALLVKGFRQRK